MRFLGRQGRTPLLLLCMAFTACEKREEPYLLSLEPYVSNTQQDKLVAGATRSQWSPGGVPDCQPAGALYEGNYKDIKVLGSMPATRPNDTEGVAVQGGRESKVGRLYGPAVFRGLQRNEILEASNSPVQALLVDGQDIVYISGRLAFRWPNGGKKYPLKTYAVAGTSSSSEVLGDIDADGNEDFGTVNNLIPPVVSIHSSQDGHRIVLIVPPEEVKVRASDLRVSGRHDVDGDGKADVLLSVSSIGWWGIYNYKGELLRSDKGSRFDDVALVADQDHDGRADLLAIDASGVGKFRILSGRDGSEIAKHMAGEGSFIGDKIEIIADVDLDGIADWVSYGTVDTESVAMIYGTAGRIPLCYCRSTRKLSGFAVGRFQSHDTLVLAVGESEEAGARVAYYSIPTPVGQVFSSRSNSGIVASLGGRDILRSEVDQFLGGTIAGLPEFVQQRVVRTLVTDLALALQADPKKNEALRKASSPDAYLAMARQATQQRHSKPQQELVYYEFDSGKEFELSSLEEVERLRNLMCAPSYNGRLILWLLDLSKRFDLPRSQFCDRQLFVPNRGNAARYVAYRFGGVERRVPISEAVARGGAFFQTPYAGKISQIRERKHGETSSYSFYVITALLEADLRSSVADREALRAQNVRFSP